MADAPPTPHDFVQKWSDRNLTERASSQAHFIELCRLLGVPAPYDNRNDDANYCFDALTAAAGSHQYAPKRTSDRKAKAPRAPLFQPDPPEAPAVTDSAAIVSAPKEGHGFADVWKRGHFCWEYKRQGVHADLAAALRQLKEYKDSLYNPPLLIVCDIDQFEIHTNFTDHPPTTYAFRVQDLADPPAEWREGRGVSPLTVLKYAFTDPEWFRPKQKNTDITADVARDVGKVAQTLRALKTPDGKPRYEPHSIAHFLMQIVFGLFAESVGYLPKGSLSELLRSTRESAKRFTEKVRDLFAAMATGGTFGQYDIDHFNGGLFRSVETQVLPDLPEPVLGALSLAFLGDEREPRNWRALEPSILGTLFERHFDPDKEKLIGAHYTSRDDIMLIVEPVVMAPLRGEWEAVKAKADPGLAPPAKNGVRKAAETTVKTFADRLSSLRILDPACGSGNFLYVAIQCLLDLERAVIVWARDRQLSIDPRVNPTQLHGIEVNDYAAELARISIWVGYLKWQIEHEIRTKRRPILDQLETIKNKDAIVACDKDGKPLSKSAEWPQAEFIIGNPPFLGSKLFRKWGLTDEYLKALYSAYDLPKTSDLCCYWFELARRAIDSARSATERPPLPSPRVGLLATQGIRGGANRTVLERIKQSGDIFLAWADREWTLDGAAVQVSMVGFDDGSQKTRFIGDVVQGKPVLRPVDQINADLSSDTDTASARPLAENAGIAYMGDTKGGSFDIDWAEAARMLARPNPHGQSNSAVVRPWVNGLDITRRPRAMWIVDFGCDSERGDAAKFEAPFRHVEKHVHPERKSNRREAYAKRWWIHVEPRPKMRERIEPLPRFLATPTLTKFRLFGWLSAPTLPDHQFIVFARADDYFFGVLHSAVHELWARRVGTQLREAESGFRYTPTTCFETFPLPWPPGQEPISPKDKHHAVYCAIADAAAELDKLRENWLNPPEWIGPMDQQVELKYRAELEAVPSGVRPLVRRSAIMAQAVHHGTKKVEGLKHRTLTRLYNVRPPWLRDAHERLDRAVLAAYAAIDPEPKSEPLRWDPDWAKAYEPFGAGEIEIKTTGKRRDTPESTAAKQAALNARKPIDERVLANLLRLNNERSPAGANG